MEADDTHDKGFTELVFDDDDFKPEFLAQIADEFGDDVIKRLRELSEKEGRCLCCGAKVTKYWYKMTAGLADILIIMLKRVRETNKNHIKLRELYDVLTPYQTTQMSKLRFHGLIAKHRDADGRHDGWVLTKRAGLWLKNEQRIPLRVQVYRNHITDKSVETVSAYDIIGSDKKEYLETTFAYERAKPAEMERATLYDRTVQAVWLGYTAGQLVNGQQYTLKMAKLQMGKPIKLQLQSKEPANLEYKDLQQFAKSWKVVNE